MTPSYGSGQHGLICGYFFVGAASGRDIGLEDALRWLQPDRDGDQGGFLWLHFNLADASAERWIQTHLAPPAEFFEALRAGSRSTRLEQAGDSLIAVVNDVAYEFTFDDAEIKTLWLAVDQRVVISARVHPLRSIDRLRQAVKEGQRFASTVSLLNHLLDDQGDVLVRIVRDATLRVDGVEDRLLQGRLTHKRSELGKLRRVLVRLQRLLAPEPGALFRRRRSASRRTAACSR